MIYLEIELSITTPDIITFMPTVMGYKGPHVEERGVTVFHQSICRRSMRFLRPPQKLRR